MDLSKPDTLCVYCGEDTAALRVENERLKTPRLTRNQPCGCVVCNCAGDERCHGCGAKNCGTHPPGEIPNPVYEGANPAQELAALNARIAELKVEADALREELRNIVNAKRFNRDHFRDDEEFADWVQNRSRAALSAFRSGEGKEEGKG